MGIRTPDLLHAIQWQDVHSSTSVQVTVSGRPHQSSGIQVGCCTFVLYGPELPPVQAERTGSRDAHAGRSTRLYLPATRDRRRERPNSSAMSARYGPLEKRTAEGITGLNLRAARDPRPVQALSICMLPISGLPLLVSPLGECGCRLDPVTSVHRHDPGAGADADPPPDGRRGTRRLGTSGRQAQGDVIRTQSRGSGSWLTLDGHPRNRPRRCRADHPSQNPLYIPVHRADRWVPRGWPGREDRRPERGWGRRGAWDLGPTRIGSIGPSRPGQPAVSWSGPRAMRRRWQR
jgi:hypothetical protein